MKILMAGSSGLVGSELISLLTQKGHTVTRLVRELPVAGKHEISWNPKQGKLDPNEVEGFDVYINLAGDNISSGRWTASKKMEILESRVCATKLLCETAAHLKQPPKLIINASAVGFYGSRGETVVDESDPQGDGFLANVCNLWEQSTESAQKVGIRVALIRIGVVLAKEGGALASMLFPFKMGLGGVIGSGKQYMSWVALDDLVRIFAFVIENDGIRGPINAVSPNPVTNYEFTKTLGKVLHRPTIFPMPAILVRLAFGEMGDELLLGSTRVEGLKLREAGYQFQYPKLEEALTHVLVEKKDALD